MENFPFRAWWAPCSLARRSWADPAVCAAVGVSPCRLPRRVPVWALCRFGAGRGPASWLVQMPSGSLVVVPSRSVIAIQPSAHSADPPAPWFAAWHHFGGHHDIPDLEVI